MAKGRRIIKSVTVELVDSVHIHMNIERVYVNGDGSVTVQKHANEPAVARYGAVANVTFQR